MRQSPEGRSDVWDFLALNNYSRSDAVGAKTDVQTAGKVTVSQHSNQLKTAAI